MKIIGFVYREGKSEIVLKGDSCLLNGRKPMFMPDWTNELGVTECMILRVSRLGKEIAPRFANRYYDAVAHGADFTALDILRAAQADGRPWTEALAFDFSLAIGEWTNGEALQSKGEWLVSPEEAISQASRLMTIRQGDLIYIQANRPPRIVQKEEIIRVEIEGEEKLYCKIK